MTTEARKNTPVLKSKAEYYFPISHRKFKPLPNIPQSSQELHNPPIETQVLAEPRIVRDNDVKQAKKLYAIQHSRNLLPKEHSYNTDAEHQLENLSSLSRLQLAFKSLSSTDQTCNFSSTGTEVENKAHFPSPTSTDVCSLRQNNTSSHMSVVDNKQSKIESSAFTQHMELLNFRKNVIRNSTRDSNTEVPHPQRIHSPKSSISSLTQETHTSSKPEVVPSEGKAQPKFSRSRITREKNEVISSTREGGLSTQSQSNQHGITTIDENTKPSLFLNTQVPEICTSANPNLDISPTSPSVKPQYLWKDLVDNSKMKYSQPLTSKEIERQETIFELINTESDYLNCLSVLVEFFEKPLLKMGILRNDKVLEIFSNLNEILLFHTELFKRMTAIYKKQFPVIQKFAFVFDECLDQMKMYSKFVVNYKKSLGKVAELRQTEKRFTWFLEQRHQKTESRNLSLEDLLLEPFQRLCRYPLLFEKILSCTHPDSPDRSDMVQVLCRIRNIIHEINEAKQRFEIREEMHLARSRIKGFGYFDFLAPSRELILEGGLTFLNVKEANSPQFVKVYRQKSFPLRVFLFNDCILLTKHRNKKTGPQYKAIAPPSRVTHVQEVEDVSVKNSKTLLKITTVNRCIERFVLEAADEKELTRWKDKINQTIPLHTRRKSDSDFELLNNHESLMDSPIPFKNFESVKINLQTSGDSFTMQTKDHFLRELQSHDENFLKEYRPVLPFWAHLQTCNESLSHSNTVYLAPTKSKSNERLLIAPTSIPGRRALPSVPIPTPLSGRKSLPVPPSQLKAPKRTVEH